MEVFCPLCGLGFDESDVFLCHCGLVWCCPWCWENDAPPYHAKNYCEETE